jgi:GT2 family glycosyltransferase
MSIPAALSHHHVTAVLVTHDGDRWLPAVLPAVAAQLRPPDRLVAVDTGSIDGTRKLLAAAPEPAAVRTLPRRTGFGAAIAAGLALAENVEPCPSGGAQEWVWLLHDDCAPQPGALRALLEQADADPSAGVLGPKVRGWYEPRALLELGVTTDRAGRRETGLERGELDQGQHDGVRDVLAVGTAGALVRRELWDRLHGLDPALPLFGDDLDLGWRVNLAGARVLVVTDAVVQHVGAADTGLRRAAPTRQPVRRARRRAAVYAMLANVPARALLLLVPRLLLGATLGGVARLALRRPRAAADELLSVLGVFASPLLLLRARWDRRRSRTLPAHAANHLLADRRLRWRRHRETLADWGGRLATSVGSGGRRGGRPSGRSGDQYVVPVERGVLRSVFGRPSVLLGAALLALALATLHPLLRAGSLAGGRLLPAPGGAADLWSSYLASWHPAGAGTSTPAPPYLALLAAMAGPLLGRAPLVVDALLLGAVPLAGLSAYAAISAVTTRRTLRVWAAGTYALLPAVTGAVAGGRLDAAAAMVALPLVTRGAGRALAAGRGDGWRTAWLAGLGLAVASAFSPLLYLLAAPVLVGAALLGIGLAGRRGSRRLGIRRALTAAVLLAVPPLLLLPWLPTLRAYPRAALAGFGPAAAGLVDPGLRPADVALLHPGGPGLPTVWLGVPLLLAALAGLARSRRWRLALAGWALAAVGLAGGVLVARVTAASLAGGAAAPAWPGVPTAVAGAGLLLAAVVAADGLFGRLTGASFSWPQPLAVAVAVAAAGVPMLAAVSWFEGAGDTVLQRRPPAAVPAFVAAEMGGSARTRALVLRPRADQTLHYVVLRGPGSALGDADLPPAPGTSARLDALVRDLAAGRGGEVAERLGATAVRYVYVPPPTDARLVRVLDSVRGLSRVAAGPGLSLWRVAGPASRLTVVSPAGSAAALPSGSASAAATLPRGPGGRTLVLAEPAGSGWRATLDGRPLPSRTAYGWAQSFSLPTDGGRLDLRYDGGPRRRGLLVQGALLAVVLLLAAPAGRRREEPEEPATPEEAGSARPRGTPEVIDLRDPVDLRVAVRR